MREWFVARIIIVARSTRSITPHASSSPTPATAASTTAAARITAVAAARAAADWWPNTLLPLLFNIESVLAIHYVQWLKRAKQTQVPVQLNLIIKLNSFKPKKKPY